MKEIEALVKSNPGQLSVEEYTLIYNKVKELSPCNMLVFGVGEDSQLWIDSNKEGITNFLEDNTEWIEKICNKTFNFKCYRVGNNRMGAKYNYDNLQEEIKDKKWDIIFVDGPDARYNERARYPSIKAASQLAKVGCHVFIHDCDRAPEAAACDEFFNKEDLVETVGKLRHYRIA